MHPVARKILLSVAVLATITPLSGCAGQLLPSEFDQTAPAVNGENIVWEDSRNAETTGTDIWLYNIGTLAQSPVVTDSGEQGQPAISDQYVVWIDDRSGLMARALPLSGANPPFDVVNGPATQADPAVCGSLVVWSDTGNNSDVYAKQLPNGPVIQVATSPAVEAYPACDAGRVVYSYSPLGEQSDIKLYDIASGQTSVVSNQFWNEWRPAISGNRVVWQAWPGPDINILGTNLATGQDFTVTDATGNQTAPVISGSTVAWENVVSSGQRQIWWRDIATTMPQQGIPVAGDGSVPGPQQAASVFGRRLVFQNNSTGPWNVDIANLFFYTGTP